ncbi:RDD family protein [Phytoactinopolyspora mesophila]|uniref:RDD family protein n=1 Tax=Phytoactinopolyspora mesophila TaxID=2650750 RepID=A0A7K3M5H7_9ACTN|nr:RDD family protein [Phytoactinopolyspora mesophila]NDL58563.1 RDD family protein [Phytoactinopolyspora mesophila]
MNDVVTGEAVPLELRLAKLPSRALSIAIDAAVYAVCGLGLYALAGAVLPALDAALATALGLATTITLLVAVPATIETLSRGKSFGKFVLGLRVVRDDGGPIRARHALVRALNGVFTDFVVTFGVGAIFCSLLNQRGKRIGDVMAGTVVLRERIPQQPGLPAVPSELAGWARTLDLSRLPNDLALDARNYLIRWQQMAPEIRDSLGARIAGQVASVVSPQPPPGVSAPAYLAAVLGERGRRETVRLSGQSTPPPRADAPTGSPFHTTPGDASPGTGSAPEAPAHPAGMLPALPGAPAGNTRPNDDSPSRDAGREEGPAHSDRSAGQNAETTRNSSGFVPPA